MIEVVLSDPQHAPEAEAAAFIAKMFPAPGAYGIQGPDGEGVVVALSAPGAEAAEAGSVLQACFPTAGTYRIGTPDEIAKAVQYAPPKPFAEWFFERLMAEAAKGIESVRDLYRRVITDFLTTHLGRHTSPAALAEFERTLFDLRQALRWQVAAPIDPDVRTRLEALGFQARDLVDFPGLAYRLGMIEARIQNAPTRPSWREILTLAAEAPVLTSDQVAIAVARERAGQYLTPVLLRDGTEAHARILERERELLRTMTPDAVARETSARTFARALYANVEGELELRRDWERVARTELQEARLRGAFEGERQAKRWTAETLVYKTLGPNPCNGCLRLWKYPDGTPFLISVGDLEREDALGPNRGPWREWHHRIGVSHPNCLDSPALTWNPALAGFFREQASKKWRAMMAERGLAA